MAVDVLTSIEIDRPREEVAAIRRANQKDLQRLKELLESGG